MALSIFLEESTDEFNGETGEIDHQTKRSIRKTKIEPTDEFIKVSRYLNIIYAYRGIPLSLVPISLLLAQRMTFKTNVVYLLKDDKAEISDMLQVSEDRVNKLIGELKKFDIIRPIARGKFEVNSFLFSTGSAVDTRNLQAHFDISNDVYIAQADQKNLITGETVRKSVANYDMKKRQKQVAGQMTFGDLETDAEPAE